ncbi:MAG: palindromic element RPE1 domain-containing protein [Holosporales bacterium]|jgi:chromosome partitioning protein|nr:palindromic element RPE1 domain-containing protein [Holosporales bacterium]
MIPYVVILGNEKGGTGKSTIAMHLVVSLLKEGCSVASIDIDARQGTLSRYLANRERTKNTPDIPMPVHTAIFKSEADNLSRAKGEDEEKLMEVVSSLQSFNYIVIDTPGNDTFLSRAAHSIADSIITPLNDSFIDLDMLVRVDNSSKIETLRPSTYAEMVWEQKKEKAKKFGGSIDWIVLRNRLSPIFSKNKEETRKILESLSKRIGFRLLSGFCERVIFRELFASGLTLLDLPEIDTQLTLSHVAARQEMHELLRALDIPVKKKTGLERVSAVTKDGVFDVPTKQGAEFGEKWRAPESAAMECAQGIDSQSQVTVSTNPQFSGPLSKPSKSEFWEGDTEHRSGAYLDVREHSSTGSTYQKTDFEEFGKRSSCDWLKRVREAAWG